MSFALLATAVAGSAVIGAGASLYGANKQADAANNAANMSQQRYNQTRSDLIPYSTTGQQANSTLANLLGTSGNTSTAGYGSLAHQFGPNDLATNLAPGYDFALKQGAQATRNQDTPGAGALSGAALKDLIGFNTGMAQQGYQNAFNNYQTQQNNIYNRLSGLANLGENAAAGVGSVGANLANNQSSAIQNAGAASGQGAVNAAGQLSNGAYLSSLFSGGGAGSSAAANGLVPSASPALAGAGTGGTLTSAISAAGGA